MSKKLLALLLAGMLAVTALTGCSKDEEESSAESGTTQSQETSKEESKAESSEESEEEKPVQIENLYDPDFSIEVLNDGIKKVIDGEDRELILVPKELAEVPAEYAESIVIRTPVENAVFLSSTQVCTFRTVSDDTIVDAIAGVSNDASNYAGIDSISSRLADGRIVDVGGGMGDPDYELIQSLEPDIVFLYTGSSPQSSQIAKLEELDINYAVDNEYMESDYRARMEWMRFILTFFNADEEINNVMLNAQKTIDEAKAAIEGKEKPTVAVFSVFDGTVYATSDSSWVGSMLKDMGGINAFSEMPAGTLTLEAAFECAQDADVIIYTSTPAYCPGIPAIEEAFPQLKECKAYEDGRIYQYGDPFWIGIDQSDIMAADLAAVIYPEVFSDRENVYFIPCNE